MSLMLNFNDPLAVEISISGGKGANLSKMFQAGFDVPPGFVITAEAYRCFIKADTQLKADMSAFDFANPEILHRQCENIRNRLRKLELPKDLQQAMSEHLPKLLSLSPVSVRSSSTLEDLAGAAFAGQHDTYLNVSDYSSVYDSIRNCFASLWEDRAVRYRHERGYDQESVTMAVVIQAMIQSKVAGVSFCIHPITGNLDQIVINAAYGFGETVVSGEGQADQFVIDKNSGKIVERLISEKTHTLIGDADGTRKIAVENEDQNKSCLNDEELEQLRKLSMSVENFYAFPQDIEWAIADGKLYLLQSRPITQFPPKWTRDESAERFPNVTTPLSWDFTHLGFHTSLTYSLKLMGMPPFHDNWFECFDGYIYGNHTAVKLFTSGRQFAFNSLDDLRKHLTLIRKHYTWVQQLPVLWARDLDSYLLTIGAFNAVRLNELSDIAVWEHILSIEALGTRYFLPNIAISITQGNLHRMLYNLLAILFPNSEVPGIYDGLTGFCETKTGLVNKDIYELYVSAKENHELVNLILNQDRRILWESGDLKKFPEFIVKLNLFLKNHGHRETDWDAYHPTWSGQPWVVLENIRLMIQNKEIVNPLFREEELRDRQRKTEEKYLNTVPEDLRFFAVELVRLTRAYTALDDLEHYQTTRMNVPFRAAAVELGARLVGKGILQLPEDIFFLHKNTLSDLMNGNISNQKASEEVQRNKSDYLKWQTITPAWNYGQTADFETVGGEFLKGIPGSPGIAKGKVFKILSVEDFQDFPHGSVLVARTTNPAWTPLFYSACAVITESGGPLSHGAVTAREIGIPAVMCVKGALNILKNGDEVQINGTGGTVRLL